MSNRSYLSGAKKRKLAEEKKEKLEEETKKNKKINAMFNVSSTEKADEQSNSQSTSNIGEIELLDDSSVLQPQLDTTETEMIAIDKQSTSHSTSNIREIELIDDSSVLQPQSDTTETEMISSIEKQNASNVIETETITIEQQFQHGLSEMCDGSEKLTIDDEVFLPSEPPMRFETDVALWNVRDDLQTLQKYWAKLGKYYLLNNSVFQTSYRSCSCVECLF